jgi:hypothetical protein
MHFITVAFANLYLKDRIIKSAKCSLCLVSTVTFGELLSDSCLPCCDDLQQSTTMMAFETILNCSSFAFWTLCLMKIPECQVAADQKQALLENLIAIDCQSGQWQ